MKISDYLNRKSAKPKSVDEAIDKYGSMNEEQLMAEMFRVSDEGRKSGELTDDKLDDFL